jgi:hypothetical protein
MSERTNNSSLPVNAFYTVKHIVGAARDLVRFDEQEYAKKKKGQDIKLLLEKHRRKSYTILFCGAGIAGGLLICPLSWAVTTAVVACQWTNVLIAQQTIITEILSNKTIESTPEAEKEEHKKRTQIFGQSNNKYGSEETLVSSED